MDGDIKSPPTKEDVVAILQAHRELGPEFDSHLADQIMDLWRKTAHGKPRERRERQERREHQSMRSVVPALTMSIPLLAIAGHYAHDLGVLAVLGLDAIVIIVSAFR